jgi:hypothetical protein
MMCKSPVCLPVLIPALIIFACASVPEQVAMEKFNKMARSYELSITWSEFEAAATHLKPGSDDVEAPDFDYLKNIDVSQYKVKKVSISDDRQQVTQVVDIQYYHKNQMIVRTISNKQIWEYDPTLKRWMLTNGLPDFQ